MADWSDRLIDDRNRAPLATAYDAMLRRSGLASSRVSDLLEEIGGHGALLARCSKTGAEGQARASGPGSLRPMRRWRERAGVEDGFPFRSLDKGGKVAVTLPPGQVARIFKRMARKAGLPESVMQDLSGYSARVGAAQDMIAAGMELPAVFQAGRWKSTSMVNRYGERLRAKRSAVAKLAHNPGARAWTARRRAGAAGSPARRREIAGYRLAFAGQSGSAVRSTAGGNAGRSLRREPTFHAGPWDAVGRIGAAPAFRRESKRLQGLAAGGGLPARATHIIGIAYVN